MKTEINLLPIESQRKRDRKPSAKNSWVVTVLGALALFLMIYSILMVMNQGNIEEINKAEAVIRRQGQAQIPYESLNSQNELAVHREKVSGAVKLNMDLPLKVLTGVLEALPLETDITGYEFKENEIILAGRTRNQEEILAFRERLMTLGICKDVSIQNTIKKPGTDMMKTSSIVEEPKAEGLKVEEPKAAVWEFIFQIHVLGVDES